MNAVDLKKQLRVNAGKLQASLATLSDESLASELLQWTSDLDADLFTVAVIGEFNRGKSSLLNAVLESDLLPTGVTPTTSTVTLLHAADKESARVHFRDGRIEDLLATTDSLRQAVAADPKISTTIDFVEIGIPHPLLTSGTIFIDTPGVSDLSTERTEVTYRFVPRADLVVFVLDATQPATRSEIDFLESVILRDALNRVLFVCNFADLLDEDEAQELAVNTQAKIANVVEAEVSPVLLTSAKAASSHSSRANSGVEQLLAKLQAMSMDGPRSRAKALSMGGRLLALVRRLEARVQEEVAAANLETEQLHRELSEREAQRNIRTAKLDKIGDWIRGRKAEVLAMTEKSLETFLSSLRDDVHDQVSIYSGADFKAFVEKQIPVLVRKRCKQWVESHGDALRSVVMRLASELTAGVNREFLCDLPLLQPAFVAIPSAMEELIVDSPDVGDGRVWAGLIVGGAGALLAITGIGIAVSALSLAAYPWLSNQLQRGNLEEAKQKAMPQLDAALFDMSNRLRANVLGLLSSEIDGLQNAAEERFMKLIEKSKAALLAELEARNSPAATRMDRVAALNTISADLETIEQSLSTMFNANLEEISA